MNSDIFYAEQFLYLVQQLKRTPPPDPSGNGNLMDNTLLVWGNELGKGNTHNRDNVPLITAGSLQGYFRKGRYLTFPRKTPNAQFLTSILHGFGLGFDVNGFGSSPNSGPLAGLT